MKGRAKLKKKDRLNEKGGMRKKILRMSRREGKYEGGKDKEEAGGGVQGWSGLWCRTPPGGHEADVQLHLPHTQQNEN